MKNENKCFFSISLENGITITGENPNEVRSFLYKLHGAFFELSMHYKKQNFDYLIQESTDIMLQVGNAINTINNNYKNKKG